MPALSGRARNSLKRIGDSCKGGAVWFRRESNGRFYLPDGREIQGAGLFELMDKGIFVPQEDGLFPGHTQTFKLNTAHS